MPEQITVKEIEVKGTTSTIKGEIIVTCTTEYSKNAGLDRNISEYITFTVEGFIGRVVVFTSGKIDGSNVQLSVSYCETQLINTMTAYANADIKQNVFNKLKNRGFTEVFKNI